MRKNINFRETHVRSASVVILWDELQEIIREDVMRRAGLRSRAGLSVKMAARRDPSIPPCEIPHGFVVDVDIEIDLLPLAEALPPEPRE